MALALFHALEIVQQQRCERVVDDPLVGHLQDGFEHRLVVGEEERGVD